MKYCRSQQGMVLIVALLLLGVISLLVFSGLRQQSLQRRIQMYRHTKLMTFAAASAALQVVEQSGMDDQLLLPRSPVVLSYQVERLTKDDCDNERYRVQVLARYHQLDSQLMAEYVKITRSGNQCQITPLLIKRLCWQQLR